MLAVWRNQSSNDEHVEKAVLHKISSEHRRWSWAEDFIHNFLQQFVKSQFSHLRLLLKEHFEDCPFKTGFFKRESKTRFTWDHFFNKSWRTFPCKSSRAGNLEDFWRQEEDLPKYNNFVMLKMARQQDNIEKKTIWLKKKTSKVSLRSFGWGLLGELFCLFSGKAVPVRERVSRGGF